MDSSLTTTALAGTILVGIVYFAYRQALPRPIPTVPYDVAASKNIFGSIPSMISYINKNGVVIPWLTGQNAKHGGAPLVQFFGLPFSKPTLVLSDFQESQDILIRRTREFDRAQRTLDGFAGIIPDHHISMRASDARFKGNKELVRDLMSPSFLQEVSAIKIHDKSLALLDLWSAKAKAANGRPFAVRQDLFDAAMDMINAAAFDFEDELSLMKQHLKQLRSSPPPPESEDDSVPVEFVRSPLTPEIAALEDSSGFLGDQVNSPMPRFTYWYRYLTDAHLRRQMAAKDAVIKGELKKSLERLQGGDGTQSSATDYMVQREFSVAKKEKRAPDFYSRRTIDELFGYIVGGHETTATALSWMLKLLADHQEAQQKLRKALKEAFPNAISESRLPTAQEIVKANVPYLDATIEESLRIGTPTPLVAREAMADTLLLGHTIPKGATILISNAGPSYLSDIAGIADSARSETSRTKHWGGAWDPQDMDAFRPERWLRESEKGDGEMVFDSQAGPFLTFSLGPRGCFGRKLAYLEIRLVVTLLLLNFHFKQLGGEMASYETEESVTVMPKHCFVALESV